MEFKTLAKCWTHLVGDKGSRHYDQELELYFEGNLDQLNNFRLAGHPDLICPLEQAFYYMEIGQWLLASHFK